MMPTQVYCRHSDRSAEIVCAFKYKMTSLGIMQIQCKLHAMRNHSTQRNLQPLTFKNGQTYDEHDGNYRISSSTIPVFYLHLMPFVLVYLNVFFFLSSSVTNVLLFCVDLYPEMSFSSMF